MTDYTRLSMRERCLLATFLDMRLNVGQIAKRMRRHRSTIYRELSRNETAGHYRPGLAHHQAQERHPRKPMKIHNDPKLYHTVYSKLRQGWSPEQIAGRMKLDKEQNSICHETIYRYIYHRGKILYQYLPSQKSKRQQRYSRKKQNCRYGDIRLITKRPKNIDKRKIFGHWEGDLIAFSGTKKKTITTLVERKSRMISLLKNTSKVSRLVMDKIANNFIQQSNISCKTITFDQGIEFADYRHIERLIKCKIYYCETHSPWQKGTNENMNGRLRRYLPRHTDIDLVTQKDLDQLADRMNNLPRKCLGFKTPNELFIKHLKENCRTKS